MSKTTISVTFEHKPGQELIHHVIIQALKAVDALDHIPDLAYCEIRLPDGRQALITGTVDDEHG